MAQKREAKKLVRLLGESSFQFHVLRVICPSVPFWDARTQPCDWFPQLKMEANGDRVLLFANLKKVAGLWHANMEIRTIRTVGG